MGTQVAHTVGSSVNGTGEVVFFFGLVVETNRSFCVQMWISIRLTSLMSGVWLRRSSSSRVSPILRTDTVRRLSTLMALFGREGNGADPLLLTGVGWENCAVIESSTISFDHPVIRLKIDGTYHCRWCFHHFLLVLGVQGMGPTAEIIDFFLLIRKSEDERCSTI